MKILILDDDWIRHAQFKKNLIGCTLTHVETAQDCIQHLKVDGPFDHCFLDHDLGGKVYVQSGKNTGYEVAEWLRDNPTKMPHNVYVHSSNPVGANNICMVLPNAKLYPFAWNKVRIG